MAEFHGRRIAAVFAADAAGHAGTGLATELYRHFHELAYADRVETRERIGFIDLIFIVGGQEFACVHRGFKPREPVQVVVRPEDVDIVPPSAGKLTGLVREVIFKGVHFEMHVDVEGKEWLIHSTQASQPGELIGMNIGPDEIHIMSREEV